MDIGGEGVGVYAEAKGEYTRQLCQFLVPALQKFYIDLVEAAKKAEPDSKKVLEVLGLVAPGKSKSLWFIAPTKPATYPYVCTYPSHWRTMNGKMRVVAKVIAPIPAQEGEKIK
jgi:hypothetical protein